MEIIIIAAMTPDGVIGAGQAMPWHLPSEQRFFKAITMGSTLIMGRKTFESIGRPLPGRTNIVLTGRQAVLHPSVHQVPSLTDAFSLCGDERIFIIGGAQVYREALPYAHTLLLTIIEHPYPGDILFPKWDKSHFSLAGECRVLDAVPYTIKLFRRITSAPGTIPGFSL